MRVKRRLTRPSPLPYNQRFPVKSFLQAIEADFVARTRRDPSVPFAERAQACLEAFRADIVRDPRALALRVFAPEPLPAQMYARATFSEFPLTLARNDEHNFCIDLYVWQSKHTHVHDHGFDGAFMVAGAQSLQTAYRFARAEAIQAGHLDLGETRVDRHAILSTGDVTRITAGETWIHDVIHLGRPTYSFLIRTLRAPDGAEVPQYRYFSGMRYKAGAFMAGIEKKIQYLDYHLDHDVPFDFADVFDRLDPYEFTRLAHRLFAKPQGRAYVEPLRARYAAKLGNWLVPALESLRDAEWAVRPRLERIQDPAAVLLGALLPTAASFAEVQGLMAAIDPRYREPEAVFAVLRRVCAEGLGEMNLPDIAYDLLAVRAERACDEDELIRALAAQGWGEALTGQEAHVRRLDRLLRENPLFRPFVARR